LLFPPPIPHLYPLLKQARMLLIRHYVVALFCFNHLSLSRIQGCSNTRKNSREKGMAAHRIQSQPSPYAKTSRIPGRRGSASVKKKSSKGRCQI
jgi:hypothetical protein